MKTSPDRGGFFLYICYKAVLISMQDILVLKLYKHKGFKGRDKGR